MRAGALIFAVMLAGCVSTRPVPSGPPAVTPTNEQLAAAQRVGISGDELQTLLTTPLYKMKPAEVGRFVAYEHTVQPSLRARVADLARKNIGQPYELYLLGEFPYEVTDDQPLFRLDKSDCVVFVEHTYAMALSQSWEEFFWMLQRIRYRDGIIGVTTRNHYTETDWDRQNAWLVTDISADLAGARAAHYEMTVDRQAFFKKRYKLDVDVPVETTTQTYVPKAVVPDVLAGLQEGDFVNIISASTTNDENKWASHVGLVVLAPNGERHILHSSEPVVREETFASFIQRAEAREAQQAAEHKTGTKRLAGFKFLRLNEAPDVPPMAPQPRPGHAPTAWGSAPNPAAPLARDERGPPGAFAWGSTPNDPGHPEIPGRPVSAN